MPACPLLTFDTFHFACCRVGKVSNASLVCFVGLFAVAGGARVDLVDQDGHSPLHWAALGGNPDVCQILIENKINPNVQDYSGRTPLQCAAYGGYINCMVVLLENKADPNIQDKEVRFSFFNTVSSEGISVLSKALSSNALSQNP